MIEPAQHLAVRAYWKWMQRVHYIVFSQRSISLEPSKSLISLLCGLQKKFEEYPGDRHG
jgi:hypothetical protein